jgi:hypothetical protein
VQTDPIGLGGGVNTYGYAGNTPTLHVDPTGLTFCGMWGDMTIDWALGRGSPNRHFSYGRQPSPFATIPRVEWARKLFREKNRPIRDEGCCELEKLQSVENVAAPFKFNEFISATLQQSCAWHFVGSFRLDIKPISCTQARFIVTNNSSFTSFSYGVFRSWETGPMGNMRQTYTWEENW